MAQLKISGFADYSEKENRLFSSWKQHLKEVYRLFGFMELNPRPVEATSSLQKKGGIAHQIYTLGRLQDGTMTDLALPFDRTVPLAIYIANHRQELTYPFKRFDISHCFRGERAQAGRFRGFVQGDIDIISPKLSTLSEVECLGALVEALTRLETPSFTVCLNHIDIPKAIIEKMGFGKEEMAGALRIIDKMDKIGVEKVAAELTALLPSADLNHLDLLSFKGSFKEFLSLAPKEVLSLHATKEFKSLLSFLGEGPFAFAPGMVRGLDYYTGVVFETFLNDYPNYGSIASGGRYNKLVDSIVNQETNLEGFGASIGLTRLFDVLKRESLLPEKVVAPATVLIAYREPELQTKAAEIAFILRDAGISVDLYSGTNPIGKQLAYASKKQIPFAFMLMGESFVIKDLENNTQSDDIVSIEEATDKLFDHLF